MKIEHANETLATIRKAIKPLGFKVKTKTMSWGRHATYVHIESGQELSFNVFTPETLERWKPLHEWIKGNSELINYVRENEDIRGLKG